MKRTKWIVTICVFLFITTTVAVAYIFFRPKLDYYENELWPYKEYIKKRSVLFGDISPTKELSEYTGEFAARFDLSNKEWEEIKKRLPSSMGNGYSWSDGNVVSQSIYDEKVFRKLFSEAELSQPAISYHDGESVRILGKDRSYDYEIVVLDFGNSKSVFFFYILYQVGTL